MFPTCAIQFSDYPNGFPNCVNHFLTYKNGYHVTETEFPFDGITFPVKETDLKNMNCEIT